MPTPEKKYSFSRWRKIDLLDLADRLNIYIATSAKKDDVIGIVENYLNSLDAPLDTLEYPELSEYYSSFRDDGDGHDSEPDRSSSRLRPKIESTSGQENEIETEIKREDGNGDMEMTSNETGEMGDEIQEEQEQEQDSNKQSFVQKNYFNKLSFGGDDDDDSKDEKNFKFKFHEYLTDIVNKSCKFNENVQFYLSNLDTVYRIFVLFEFLSLVYGICNGEHGLNVKNHSSKDFIARLEYGDILMICLIWFISYVGIPILTGYYFNFAREIFDLSVDQMVYNLSKLLVIYTIHSNPLFTKSYNYNNNNNNGGGVVNDFVAGLVGKKQGYLNRFEYYMEIITDSLGNKPFVFTIISSVLTIYVYILYVL